MASLLTVLTLSVLQLAFALHVRSTVLDSAAEGARFAALADNGLGDGVARTRALVTAAIGPTYAADIRADYGVFLGHRAVVVTVRAPLPVLGLLGPQRSLEVRGHAAVEEIPSG